MGIYGNIIKELEQGKTHQLYSRHAVTFVEENRELRFSIEGWVLLINYRF